MNNSNNSSQKELDELLNKIDNLSLEQRNKLIQKLLDSAFGKTGVTFVLGGNNVINNLFAVQLNSSSEAIEKQLEKIPPEAIGNLMEALASYLKNNDFH